MKHPKLESCFAVVRGAAMLGIVVLRLVSTSMRAIGAATSVFGLCAFCGEDSLLCSFASTLCTSSYLSALLLLVPSPSGDRIFLEYEKEIAPIRQFLDFLIDAFYQLISLRSNTYRWKHRQFDRARQKDKQK